MLPIPEDVEAGVLLAVHRTLLDVGSTAAPRTCYVDMPRLLTSLSRGPAVPLEEAVKRSHALSLLGGMLGREAEELLDLVRPLNVLAKEA